MIGFVDAMRVGKDVESEWTEHGIGNMINETYYTQYFNNVFWQNDPDVVYLRDVNNDLNEIQKNSLALWNGMLGGVVCTSDRFSTWDEDQLRMWRFLQPQERPQSASLPFWGQDKKFKLALRRYKDPRAWGLLVFNDNEEMMHETYTIDDLIGQRNAWVYLWESGKSTGLGKLNKITVTLQKHESKLLYLNDGNSNPPEDLSISGVSLEKFYRKYSRDK